MASHAFLHNLSTVARRKPRKTRTIRAELTHLGERVNNNNRCSNTYTYMVLSRAVNSLIQQYSGHVQSRNLTERKVDEKEIEDEEPDERGPYLKGPTNPTTQLAGPTGIQQYLRYASDALSL